MSLTTQIFGLLFSLGFGFLFSFFVSINYKMIYSSKKYIKTISSVVIVVIGVLLYFTILKSITFGAFHAYFAIALLIGSLVENVIHKAVAQKFKK